VEQKHMEWTPCRILDVVISGALGLGLSLFLLQFLLFLLLLALPFLVLQAFDEFVSKEPDSGENDDESNEVNEWMDLNVICRPVLLKDFFQLISLRLSLQELIREILPLHHFGHE